MPRTPQSSLNKWKPGQPWRGSGVPNVTLDSAMSGANQNDPTQANTSLHVGQTQILPGGVLSNVQLTPGAASNVVNMSIDGLTSTSGVGLIWNPVFPIPFSISIQGVLVLGVDASFIGMAAGTVVSLSVLLSTTQGPTLDPTTLFESTIDITSGPNFVSLHPPYNVPYARVFAILPNELQAAGSQPTITFYAATIIWTQSSGSNFPAKARFALAGISR